MPGCATLCQVVSMCARGRELRRLADPAIVPGCARMCQVVTKAIAHSVAHSGCAGRVPGPPTRRLTGRELPRCSPRLKGLSRPLGLEQRDAPRRPESAGRAAPSLEEMRRRVPGREDPCRAAASRSGGSPTCPRLSGLAAVAGSAGPLDGCRRRRPGSGSPRAIPWGTPPRGARRRIAVDPRERQPRSRSAFAPTLRPK